LDDLMNFFFFFLFPYFNIIFKNNNIVL